MNHFILASFLLVTIFAVSHASLLRQIVKEGEEVKVPYFRGAKGIKRTVSAGEQIFHLEGKNKGSFVDENEKKVGSSNYETKDGFLIIKKFTKDDVGSYSEHPAKGFALHISFE